MATTIESSKLDFNNIKSKLKTYLSQVDEFSDYDFEGSGLSNILDVLAYNTHFNSLIANMAINESFLETAQLRPSVLTHSQSIGYYPRSRTAAKAQIRLSADLSSYVGSRPEVLTIAPGKTFTVTIDGTGYTFSTRETLSATDDGNGAYKFQTSAGSEEFYIYEGSTKTKTFLVPDSADSQLYVIPDKNADTSTFDVRVFGSTSTTDYDTYSNIRDAISINTESRNYILKESPNGYYELEFGNGTNFGNKPKPGYKITVSYLSSSGADANDGKVFSPSAGITTGGQTFTLTSTTVTKSTAGAEKETISEIRSNAPLTYATQKRMVTAEDYNTLIAANYPTVSDITSWGGQDNIPIDYGAVYISLKFPESTDAATITATKSDISKNLVEPLSTISITPKFIDPVVTYLTITTTFDYNPTLSGVTLHTMENNVSTAISTYFTANLDKFKKEYRRSNLLSVLDEVSPAVLSTKIEAKMSQRFTPKLNTNRNYDVNFPSPIAGTDDENYIITSSRFIYNGNICTIRNKLETYNLELVTTAGEVILNNIGTFTPGNGTVSIVSLNPTSIVGNLSYITITAAPANQGAIKPLRNYILSLDPNSTTRGIIDYQTTRVTL